MFGKFKEKLKSWFKKAEKQAEPEAVETKKPVKQKTSKKEKKEIKKETAVIPIPPKKPEEKAKKKETKKPEDKKVKDKKESVKQETELPVPTKFNVGKEKVEPDLEQIKQTAQEIEKQEIKEIEQSSATQEVEKPEEKAEKKGFFSKLTGKFKFKITEEYFQEIFSELELIMLENNVALQVVEKMQSDLKQELLGLEIKKDKVEEQIKQALRISIESLFPKPINLIEQIKNSKKPYIILFFGTNGAGKTTTIAKVAHLLQKNKIKCVLAAADTFRAASIEQLEEHANKLKTKIIKGQYNADPSSVAFDAISHAKAHKIDCVLIDTAGRMYTKKDLMREMEKIVRVTKPDMKIFIAESITGNDAIEQAKTFNESVGIDSIILSKADVDAKGGTIISVSYITGKPILYLGTGQNYEDLELFNKNKILEQLGL